MVQWNIRAVSSQTLGRCWWQDRWCCHSLVCIWCAFPPLEKWAKPSDCHIWVTSIGCGLFPQAGTDFQIGSTDSWLLLVTECLVAGFCFHKLEQSTNGNVGIRGWQMLDTRCLVKSPSCRFLVWQKCGTGNTMVIPNRWWPRKLWRPEYPLRTKWLICHFHSVTFPCRWWSSIGTRPTKTLDESVKINQMIWLWPTGKYRIRKS